MFGNKHGTFWLIQTSIQYKGDNIIKKGRHILNCCYPWEDLNRTQNIQGTFLRSQQRSHKLQDEKY